MYYLILLLARRCDFKLYGMFSRQREPDNDSGSRNIITVRLFLTRCACSDADDGDICLLLSVKK